MFCAITISLVPEAQGGPFVIWDRLDNACQRAAALGFNAVEIFPPTAEHLNARELRDLLRKHELRLAALGTGAGWVLRKLRLTDPDPGVRRRAIDFAGSIVDLAGSFGAPAIIGSMQGRWDPSATRDQAIEWLAAALDQLGPRAHALGVPLLIEPLNRYETNLLNTVDETLALLDRLHTQNVQILCDLFHMNIEERNIPDALRAAGSKLGHVHFADSNRRAIGFGHTDMAPIAAVLREIGYQNGVSAEILPLPTTEEAGRQTLVAYRRHFQTMD
jgi:sugar phosphate isomerase/epimerase